MWQWTGGVTGSAFLDAMIRVTRKGLPPDLSASIIPVCNFSALAVMEVHCHQECGGSINGDEPMNVLVKMGLAVTGAVFAVALCMKVSGCGGEESSDATQISLSNGIVKIGMPARDVKALLGPPVSMNRRILTYSSATGTNAESTCDLGWVLLETLGPFFKRVVVYEASFTVTHPWSKPPGNPASDYDKDDAGWTLEALRRHVINDRKFKRWMQMDEAESNEPD